MCLGNRADISSRYTNDQLCILYKNARHHIEKHRHDDRPVSEESEFAILAQFNVADIGASFEFDCPTIEFICDHDVILYLNIKHASYRLNYKGGSPRWGTTVENRRVAFRIPFSRYATENFSCSIIENKTNHTVDKHILNIKSAIPLPLPCNGTKDDEDDLTALSHWLLQYYLPALKKAGLHVLYSPPNFAITESKATSSLDYSIVGTREPTTDSIFGVKVNDINKHFHELWSEAEELVRRNSESSFLAQLRISSKVDVKEEYYDLHFGPVRVQALCESEVILYLDIQSIYVYSGKEQKAKYKDWKVAFIADVIEDSAKFYININTARISEVRSTLGVNEEQLGKRILGELKEAVLVRMKELGYHIIKKSLPTRSSPGIVSFPSFPLEPLTPRSNHKDDQAATQKKLPEPTRTTRSEPLAVLTQESINKRFKSLWESALEQGSLPDVAAFADESEAFQRKACLAQFSVSQWGKAFAAEFYAPEVQLVHEERSVILYLHIKKGSLKVLGGESTRLGDDRHNFSNKRVAFEMKLKVVDTANDVESSNNTNWLKIHEPTGYKHIILSLSSAKFNPEASDLLDTDELQRALEYYIRNHYFPVFERAHHNVLFTVPHPQDGSGKRIVHRMLTSLKFEIAFFFTGSAHATFNRNAIVIMGMTSDVLLPRVSIPPGLKEICGGRGYVHNGTVDLSRSSILEGILLKHLDRINHETTIVPYFPRVVDDRLIFDLVTWDNHAAKNGKKCSMREITKQGNGTDNLLFAWKNGELWVHKYGFDEDVIYTLDCKTNNELTLWTMRLGECDIQINGTVKIKLVYAEGKANSVADWSSEITVSWSATISLISTHSGLDVLLRPTKVVPHIRSDQVFPRGTPGYEAQKEALDQLKKVFPSSVDLMPLVRELKYALEGVWDGVQVDTYEYYFSRPVFNRGGDLVLELVVRGSGSDE